VDAPSFASIQPVRIYNVLVVDDVLMNRDIASSFLRLGGHTATCVESGADAVAAAGQNDFDVILMDVRMPGMDGLEATRRIRALGPGRGDVPIVALTAQAFTDQIAACRAAGMDSHLAKPFDPDTLLAAVTQAVTTGHKAVEVKKATVADDAVAETHFDALAYAGDTLNKATFDRTTSFLPPETAAGYLRTIHELADSLLRRLRMPGAIARDGDDLADTVHSLCGSAAMFGFDRLNGVGRRFEHAIRSGSPDVTPLAEGLIAALEATLAEIHTMRSADAVH
jgi:CheY-like chemotaxis protein/HPt (histidine-containing phosphotransfer) domain-containing protein